MEYTQEGLIKYICEKVDGIGAKTADRIAGFMEDVLNFYDNTNQLSNFVTAKGARVVKDRQIIGDLCINPPLIQAKLVKFCSSKHHKYYPQCLGNKLPNTRLQMPF